MKYIAFALMTIALLLPAPAHAQGPLTESVVNVCGRVQVEYTFSKTVYCPYMLVPEIVIVEIRGPKDTSGEIAYEVTGVEPFGWRSNREDIREWQVFWDTRYLSVLSPMQVSYSIVVTDTTTLPFSQTIEIVTMYHCDRLYALMDRVTWLNGQCLWLPIMSK